MSVKVAGPGTDTADAEAALAAELANAKTVGEAKAASKKIADHCNSKVNKGKKLPLKGKACTRAGTEKHKCCENIVKAAGDPPVRAEVPLDRNGNDVSDSYDKAKKMANRACKNARQRGVNPKGIWGRVFFANCPMNLKPDVIFKDENGKNHAFDFKFPCKNKKGSNMNKKQRDKYNKLFPNGAWDSIVTPTV